MKSKEKVYDYTNCSCKYYCADCGWFDNFHGFQSYRNILENETSI
jgi:hypothetical protein